MREINVSIGNGGLTSNSDGLGLWFWLMALVGVVGLIYMGIKFMARMRKSNDEK